MRGKKAKQIRQQAKDLVTLDEIHEPTYYKVITHPAKSVFINNKPRYYNPTQIVVDSRYRRTVLDIKNNKQH